MAIAFTLLDDIACVLDPAAAAVKVGMDPAGEDLAEIEQLFATAPRPRPKACWAEVAVAVEGDRVVLAGETFTSALLARNIAGHERVWPYLATCGMELYDWARGVDDPFLRYAAEEALVQGLAAAYQALSEAFEARYPGVKTAAMNPGSLTEWPISEQRPMFRLLAEAARATGIVLGESLLMTPNKSVSGIRFPNEHGYVNCRLCPRESCPNRRAPRDVDTATTSASSRACDGLIPH